MRVLSGVQPTGDLHLGNYFGAIRNWVRLQEEHECFYCVVDLHAMTMPYAAETLRINSSGMILDLLACGVDPERSLLFQQSQVPEHAELAWILNCVTPFGDLERMTQFKEKRDQIREKDVEVYVSAGLFTYLVLQAADIMIYRAQGVPVGKDQQQHLELAREIARRFNRVFGELFPEPEPMWSEAPKIMSLAEPNSKMSKSLGARHYISIYEDPDALRRKVMSAVTDSGSGGISPGVENLLTLLSAAGQADVAAEMTAAHRKGLLRYSDLKSRVVDALIEVTNTFRERRAALESQRAAIMDRAWDHALKARKEARVTLERARELTGLPLHVEVS